MKSILSIRLDTRFCVTFACLCVLLFFFFALISGANNTVTATVHALLMNSSRNIWFFSTPVGPVNSAWDPQILLFSNFFIKNGSHGTIHIFKNYFTTMFSVFSFSKINSIQMDPKKDDWNIKVTKSYRMFLISSQRMNLLV